MEETEKIYEWGIRKFNKQIIGENWNDEKTHNNTTKHYTNN